MVTINGEIQSADGMTVMELLSSMQLMPERTAVMIGGEILPKSDYNTVLKDGDKVDIVGFVGGG